MYVLKKKSACKWTQFKIMVFKGQLYFTGFCMNVIVSVYSSYIVSDTFSTYDCHRFSQAHSGTAPYLMVWHTPHFLTGKLVLHVRI